MMKIITGSTGTAHVTSNNDGEFNQSIWGNELVVFDNGEKLAASIADNNTITIADGDICLQGRHALIEPGTVEDVTIETGSVGMNRIDLIVAHYEIDTETGFESISLEVIKGNETAGTPTVPAYTEGDIRTGATVAEAPLYEVKIENVAISSVTAKFKTEPSIKQSISEINNDLSELATRFQSGHIVCPAHTAGNTTATRINFPKNMPNTEYSAFVSLSRREKSGGFVAGASLTLSDYSDRGFDVKITADENIDANTYYLDWFVMAN